MPSSSRSARSPPQSPLSPLRRKKPGCFGMHAHGSIVRSACAGAAAAKTTALHVTRRIGDASLGEPFAPEVTRVAATACSAIRGRIITRVGDSVIDAERGARANDLGLGDL